MISKIKILNNYLLQLKNSPFLMSVSQMMFYTIVSQLISVFMLPVLSRMYSPIAFGLHTSFRANIVIYSAFISLGIDQAILACHKNVKRVQIVNSLLTISFIVCFLSLLLLFVLKQFNIVDVLFVLGGMLLLVTNVFQSFLISCKLSKLVALSRIVLPLSFFLMSMLFSYSYVDEKALVVCQFIAYICLFLYLSYFMNSIGFCYKFSLINVRNVLYEYITYVKYIYPGVFINIISLNIPVVMLGWFYAKDLLGVYGMGMKIVSLPIGIVAGSLSQLFFKKFSDLINFSDVKVIWLFYKRIIIILSFVSLFIFLIIFYFSDFFPILLGDNWSDVIWIIKWMCLWQFLMFINNSISSVFIILSKKSFLFVYQLIYLLFRILSILVPFYLGLDGDVAIISYALVGFIANIFLLIFNINFVRTFIRIKVCELSA